MTARFNPQSLVRRLQTLDPALRATLLHLLDDTQAARTALSELLSGGLEPYALPNSTATQGALLEAFRLRSRAINSWLEGALDAVPTTLLHSAELFSSARKPLQAGATRAVLGLHYAEEAASPDPAILCLEAALPCLPSLQTAPWLHTFALLTLARCYAQIGRHDDVRRSLRTPRPTLAHPHDVLRAQWLDSRITGLTSSAAHAVRQLASCSQSLLANGLVREALLAARDTVVLAHLSGSRAPHPLIETLRSQLHPGPFSEPFSLLDEFAGRMANGLPYSDTSSRFEALVPSFYRFRCDRPFALDPGPAQQDAFSGAATS